MTSLLFVVTNLNCQILNTNLEKKLQTHEKTSKNLQFFCEKDYCFAILNLFFILYPQGFHLLLFRLRREIFAEFARFSGVTWKVFSYSKHTLPCSGEHQVWSGSIHLERLKTYLAVFGRTQAFWAAWKIFSGSKDILPCAKAHQLKSPIQCL